MYPVGNPFLKLQFVFCIECAWREYVADAVVALREHKINECPFRNRKTKEQNAQSEEAK